MNRYFVLLIALCLLGACGGNSTPTPDLAATQVAVEVAAHATMTAEAPTPTNTPTPTTIPTDTPQPTPTLTPTSTPVPPTATPSGPPTPTPEPVTYPVGECMSILKPRSATVPFRYEFKECVESVTVLSDGSMKVNFVWEDTRLEPGELPSGYCLIKGSDYLNKNMYMVDNLGNRYDHTDGGGYINQAVLCENEEHGSITGFFLFPPAQPGAESLVFFDDDQGIQTAPFEVVWPTMTAQLPTPEATSASEQTFASRYGERPPIDAANASKLENFASRPKSAVGSISLSPDETKVAVSDSVGASILDLITRRDVVRYLEYDEEPVLVRWSPDGTMIAGSQFSRVVQFWDPDTGETVGSLEVNSSQPVVLDMDWSPGSRHLVTLSDEPFAFVWDVDTMELAYTVETGSDARFISAAWSPDGKTLALGAHEGGVILISAVNGETVTTLGEGQGWVHALAWSSDGGLLAYTGDSMINIYDTDAGVTVNSFQGWLNSINVLRWSPDDRLIAAGHATGVLAVWEAEQGKELFRDTHTMFDHTVGLEWNSEGTLIITGSRDGWIRYWGIPEE